MNHDSYHVASSEVTIKTLTREIKQMILRHEMEYPNGYRIDPEVFFEEMTRRMVVSLRARIAAKKFETKTVRFPATWWDAFKLRFFPANAIKRWPVNFEEVTLEAWAYHPDISIPDHQTFVEIVVNSREWK
jgi:hypothetical protein